MKKLNKKAFTIVELVIVIAVIAVLAAVLIPTFASLIRKSKVSKDTQLIRNLNTALADDRVTTAHGTMTDALVAADKYGYNVAKINASAKDNEILWDSKNDVFCYLNEGAVEYMPDSVKDTDKLSATDYRLWKIFDKAPAADNTFSIYVASQAAADYVATNDVNVGVDCGDYNVDTLNYVNKATARNVTIRTNGGTLTVDAPDDKVYHYGVANVVDIKAVDDASYYERGIVSLAKIKTGRLVVAEEAVLASVHVVATNGNYTNIKVGLVGTAQLPTFTRDEVTLNDGDKKLVLEVQVLASVTAVDTSPEYVWISMNGTDVDVDVATSASELTEGTKVAEAAQSTAVKATTATVDAGVTAEDLADMVSVAARYAGGQGTESNPYLLATKAHFASLDEDVNGGETAGKYFQLITDIDLGKIYPIGSMGLVGNNGTSSTSYSISYTVAFEGVLDGANHTLKYNMVADEYQAGNVLGLFGATLNSTIKNLTLDADVASTKASVWVGALAGFGWQSNLENVTVNGTVQGAHDVGGFFGYYATWDTTPVANTIKNCINNATVICNSKRTNYAIAGGFVGQLAFDDANYTLTFDNCQSNGNIVVANTASAYSTASYFVGFGSDNAADHGYDIVLNFNNCSVGAQTTVTSDLGDKRTNNNKSAYSTYSAAAVAACPAVKYVGCTSKTTEANPANYSRNQVYINGVLQDMTLYFIQ